MPLTTEFKNTLLSAICGKGGSIPGKIYAALSSTNPSTSVTEPSARSYKRAKVADGSDNLMGTAQGGVIKNTATIYFPEAVETWGTVAYVALYTAASGGQLIGYAHIVDEEGHDTTLEIPERTVPLIRADKFTLEFTDAL